MENYEYKVQLGRHTARNEKEVQALQRAVHATGSQVRSLVITMDSMNGLAAEQKLLESPWLSYVENLSLKLDFSLGATSLGILAKAIETGHFSSFHLSISYHDISDQDGEHLRQHPRSSFSSSSPDSKSSSAYTMFSSSRSGGRPGGHDSRTSSSPTSRNQVSSFEDRVSWEGFALLAGVLRDNSLPRLAKTVSLSSNWGFKNLGDVGVKCLAKLIDTGYLSGLKELNLEGNLIGSAGMEALAVAFRGGGNMVSLEVLNLNENAIHSSGTGIMEMVRALEGGCLPNLKWIGLSGAGSQAIPNGGSVADEIGAAFTRNTSLTTYVEVDWPDKRLQAKWNGLLERNSKHTKSLQQCSGRDEAPVANWKTCICGFARRGRRQL